MNCQIGSCTVRLSNAGTVIDEEEYYPFGDSSLRTFTYKRYRYVGKERDAESGLYYYGARYYAAWTCRFISVDPLAKDYPFYTPYNYAGNKPINKIDIDGMQEGNKDGGGTATAAPTGGVTPTPSQNSVKAPTSTKLDAIKKIDTLCANLKQSNFFKNVTPDEFISQLKDRINNPSGISQGQGTNFCWAAACMSYALEKNPQGMVEALFSLYTKGVFSYNNNNGGLSIAPADYIRDAVGSNTFDNNEGLKGKEVDQMLFMTVASYFKGYLNQDDHYNAGDEEGTWASGNLSKAKELWNSFGYNVTVSGADLGWAEMNKGGVVMEALKNNDVVLFINSPLLLRDNWVANWSGTHYIRVDKMSSTEGKYKINYWDYGSWKTGKDARTVSPFQFNSATYGVISIPK